MCRAIKYYLHVFLWLHNYVYLIISYIQLVKLIYAIVFVGVGLMLEQCSKPC